MMQRVVAIKQPGSFAVSDRVVLDADERQRRRIVLAGEKGTRLLLDFAKPMILRDGDGLVLEDGSVVQVVGRVELLVEVSATAPADVVRLAWHIGNRHTDIQFTDQSFPHPARSRAGRDAERSRCDHARGRGTVRSRACGAAWASSRS
jgi:urease accessory protein UreE